MKYSAQTVKDILTHIEMGNTQKDASALEGVGESTWQEWKHKHPELPELVKKADAKCKALHIANVRRHAFGLEGVTVRWTASAWWLERRYPEEFALKWAGELSGKGGKPLIPDNTPKVDLSHLTKEQLITMGSHLAKIISPVKVEGPKNGNGNGPGHP